MVQKAMVCVKQSFQTQWATLGFLHWTEHATHKIYFSKAAFWVGLVRGCTVTALAYQQLFCIKHLCFHYVYFLGYLERDHSKETLVRSQRISPKDIDIVLPYILECATEVSKWALEGTQLKQQLCAALNLRNYVTGNQPSHWVSSYY